MISETSATPPATPRFRRGSTLGYTYFALQAAAGALWWLAVFSSAWVREMTLGGLDPVALALLDIPLFVAASGLAAARIRPARWVVTLWAALVTAGLACYATVTGEASWGVLLMLTATTGSLAASLLVTHGRLPTEWIFNGPFAFHTARPAGTLRHLGRTGRQIVVFWGLCLGVIPLLITFLERRWGLAIAVPLALTTAGIALFLIASALGIWSAVTMSTRGEGTPLPAAMPHRLVVAGPYRYVRNPMAVAGIAQGVAVGLSAGSWLVVIYALCGSLVWNWVIRPREEADLEARFGNEYRDYRDRVFCWVPRSRFTPA
ncbi:isoprenylcysteine carboxylmethyltransferase family protein [Klugiella xanthotipulae]|uniref:methyltransferase family protein n=1 Tax=Klugiella xanthotipulae TaxID=244735 RepID=UPI00319DE571